MFTIASIAAAEKRPLSYQTPQSVAWFETGAQTLPLTMHYWGKKIGGKQGKEWSDFDPQRKGSYCWGSGLWSKVSSKLNENCDRRSGDRQTEGQTHRRE